MKKHFHFSSIKSVARTGRGPRSQAPALEGVAANCREGAWVRKGEVDTDSADVIVVVVVVDIGPRRCPSRISKGIKTPACAGVGSLSTRALLFQTFASF